MHKENTPQLHEVIARKLLANGADRTIQRKVLQVGHILVGPVGPASPRFRGRVSNTVSVLDIMVELSSAIFRRANWANRANIDKAWA